MKRILLNLILIFACYNCIHAQETNPIIVDDISTYTQRIYPEVFNKSDNSWYMLNSHNEYEKYGVIVPVPTKHKWHPLNTLYIRDGQEVLPHKYLGFKTLRVSFTSTRAVSEVGQIFFNNTPEIEDNEHYYLTVGTGGASLTRVWPGRQWYKDLITNDVNSDSFCNVGKGKYEYTFEQTMYHHGYSNEYAKSAGVEIYIPDLDDISTYQGKIVIMNDSLYMYDQGYWKSKGANKKGWIQYTNDLSYSVSISSIRADLSEYIGFGCCWAGFEDANGNTLGISLWDKAFQINKGSYMSIENEQKVDGTTATYQIDFNRYNINCVNHKNGDFNYAFFATQVYAENYPAEYVVKPAPEGFGNNDNTSQECSEPSITYSNGQISFNCSTKGAKFKYSISSPDFCIDKESYGSVVLSSYYEISVCAFAEGYAQSKIVRARIYWIEGNLEETDNINDVRTRGIMLQNKNGMILVSGLEENETVSLYNVSGALLSKVRAYNGNASYVVTTNDDIVIVKINDKSIKVKLNK